MQTKVTKFSLMSDTNTRFHNKQLITAKNFSPSSNANVIFLEVTLGHFMAEARFRS